MKLYNSRQRPKSPERRFIKGVVIIPVQEQLEQEAVLKIEQNIQGVQQESVKGENTHEQT